MIKCYDWEGWISVARIPTGTPPGMHKPPRRPTVAAAFDTDSRKLGKFNNSDGRETAGDNAWGWSLETHGYMGYRNIPICGFATNLYLCLYRVGLLLRTLCGYCLI